MPSKLEQMQLQLRQKLMQEKEEKLIKIYNNNQEKVLSKFSRSNELPRRDGNSLKSSPVVRVPENTFSVSSSRNLPVKKGSPGVDRSRPLMPIRKPNLGGGHGSVSTSSTVQNGTGSSDAIKKNTKSRANVEEYKRMRAEVKRKELDLVAKIKDQQTKHNGIAQETKNIENLSKLKIGRTSPIRSVAKENTFGTSKSMLSNFSTVNKNKTSRYSGASNIKSSPVPPPPNTVSCSLCGRHFAKDRIEKHQVICQKVTQKKRKTFDASKMRVKGTEAESFVRKRISVKDEPMKKKSNWRAKHESFLESIREAKKVQKHLAAGGKISDLPPPKPSENPDYVPCPYCNRKFNQAVAERHIPKCKNIISNKPKRK